MRLTPASAKFVAALCLSVVAAFAQPLLYVSQSGPLQISQITAAGGVTSWPVNASGPQGLAFSAEGELFAGIDGTASIVRVSATGVLTTFAPGISYPRGLAFNAAGELFVATVNQGLFRITRNGTVSVFANLPDLRGLAFDAAGNLYASHSGGNRIHKIAPNGQVSTFATGLTAPQGLAFDRAGNLLVAHPETSAILSGGLVTRITPAGVATTIARLADFQIRDIACDPVTGVLYVCTLSTIYLIEPDGIPRVFVRLGGPTYLAIPPLTPPSITEQPRSLTATVGSRATLEVVAAGSAPLTYQWFKDGAPIAGATAPVYSLPAVTASAAGRYTVTITNGAGSITSAPALLTLIPQAFLSNLSVRSPLDVGEVLIVGLAVAEGGKPVLVRAAGPALGALGVAGAAADPRMEIFKGSARIAENDNWAADLAPVFSSLGAFGFSAGSDDAALLQRLDGANSVHVRSASSGVVLFESYDAGAPAAARLVNLSTRSHVGSGDGVLVAGFHISGSGTLRILLRGAGPALAPLGVSGALPDPRLEVFDSAGRKIGENDEWDASLAPTFTAVGAFSFATGSRDSALVLMLTAGRSYTVQLSSADLRLGEGLIEVYEVP
ncbi:MAG: immunoglobulin domain-containing protein [Verrucomicrobiota bacterium]